MKLTYETKPTVANLTDALEMVVKEFSAYSDAMRKHGCGHLQYGSDSMAWEDQDLMLALVRRARNSMGGR